ncbi:ralA-binding protein 1-A-like isoform X2 [Gigantopelta aegis]|uniref:ralA-binding protein 1-A-like isoform X2 n=1 Tax=Gigantopelta aegis TaxID=1735272 RepID=UPI001B888D5F|nr:ralA-binding protein 1-A-like isoform X2 [Gigantopelta aegis]
MSFESPDNEKHFPGLYKAGVVPDQLSVTEDDYEKQSKKKELGLGKKKDGRRDKKEKGYTQFEEEESEEEIVPMDDIKSPSKVKKSKPGFKFPARKDIFVKKEKHVPEEKKEKELKKEEKDKKKEEKDGKKQKVKGRKKGKHRFSLTERPEQETVASPIFGIPLAQAVERNRCHDGIELPAIFRECVDYIEEYGLSCEGIYRISGVKSKVQHLKDCYNKGVVAPLEEHEPNVVASLLKQFLRELPEPVLTTAAMAKFEEASTIKNNKKRVEQFRKLIDELPTCNRLLLSWMIVHMTHIIELQKENKMTLQNVSIVLSPTMQISHRVLNVLFTYTHQIFSEDLIKRYVPPLKPATSRWSLELPDTPAAAEEELAKQESLLSQLHEELNAGVKDPVKEEQLWEVQRVVTQLKRKIKFAKKGVDVRRKDTEGKKTSGNLADVEELQLTLREIPATKDTDTDESKPVKPAVENKEKKSPKVRDLASGGDTKQTKGPAPLAPPGAEDRSLGSGDEKKPVDEEVPESQTEVKSSEQEDGDGLKSGEEKTEEGEEDLPDGKTDMAADDDKVKMKKSKLVAEDQTKKPDVPIKKADVHLKKADGQVTKADIPITKADVQVTKGDGQVTKADVQVTKADVQVTKADVQVTKADVQVTKTDGQVTKADVQVTKADVQSKVADVKVDQAKDMKEAAGKKAKMAEQEVEESPNAVVKVEGIPVHPHVHLTSELLQPIKAEPVTPKKEETVDSSIRKSDELRVLEEELLGEKKPETKQVQFSERTKQTPNLKVDKKSTAFTVQADVHIDGQEDVLWDVDDEETKALMEECEAQKMEEEELLAIADELRQKIETEESEIERLHQEIQELQYLRQDSDLEDMSSCSDSSDESEDEEELQDILLTLKQENEILEKQNSELCQKIHEERMICLSVKLEIRLLQQRQLESSANSSGGQDRETFL